MDQASTLEDILRNQGELVKKGKLGIRQGKVVGNEGEEDIEFWEDGTETRGKYKKDGESKGEGEEEEEDTVL